MLCKVPCMGSLVGSSIGQVLNWSSMSYYYAAHMNIEALTEFRLCKSFLHWWIGTFSNNLIQCLAIFKYNLNNIFLRNYFIEWKRNKHMFYFRTSKSLKVCFYQEFIMDTYKTTCYSISWKFVDAWYDHKQVKVKLQ